VLDATRLYRDGAAKLGRLDGRRLSYRFDLERDPAWSRGDEPGTHAPAALLGDLGVNVAALGDHAATFDWMYAAAVCRSFALLERLILAFTRRERALLPPSRSLDALCEEEEKHVALFERYERHLLGRHDREAFERAWAPVGRRLDAQHASLHDRADHLERHYVFWLNTIFFEELTVWLAERYAAADAQPTWVSLHRLHRVEELQHLATDAACVEALALDEARRDELGQRFVVGVAQSFTDALGLGPALAHLAALGVRDVWPAGRLSQLPFFRALGEAPAFRRTRAAAPCLRRGGAA
jgi:hypothetical protein